MCIFAFDCCTKKKKKWYWALEFKVLCVVFCLSSLYFLWMCQNKRSQLNNLEIQFVSKIIWNWYNWNTWDLPLRSLSIQFRVCCVCNNFFFGIIENEWASLGKKQTSEQHKGANKPKQKKKKRWCQKKTSYQFTRTLS